jgi:hypothetical protein
VISWRLSTYNSPGLAKRWVLPSWFTWHRLSLVNLITSRTLSLFNCPIWHQVLPFSLLMIFVGVWSISTDLVVYLMGGGQLPWLKVLLPLKLLHLLHLLQNKLILLDLLLPLTILSQLLSHHHQNWKCTKMLGLVPSIFLRIAKNYFARCSSVSFVGATIIPSRTALWWKTGW